MLPVMKKGKFVDIVTDRDLKKASAPTVHPLINAAHQALAKLRVTIRELPPLKKSGINPEFFTAVLPPGYGIVWIALC